MPIRPTPHDHAFSAETLDEKAARLRSTQDTTPVVDEMAASLRRDGFGEDEIAHMDRRVRYAKALASVHNEGFDWGPEADAAMAVADTEQRDLLAMLQAERAQADGIITGLRAKRADVVDKLNAADEENARLRAELNKVNGRFEATAREAAESAQTVERLRAELEKARTVALTEAADALDESETLRDLTDDHMHDVNAAANELRRMATEAPQADHPGPETPA